MFVCARALGGWGEGIAQVHVLEIFDSSFTVRRCPLNFKISLILLLLSLERSGYWEMLLTLMRVVQRVTYQETWTGEE